MNLPLRLTALSLLLAACAPEADPDPFAHEQLEQPIDGLVCPVGAEADSVAACSSTLPSQVYTSLLRVGRNAEDTASSEVAQTFRPLLAGVPYAVRLQVRLLRDLEAAATLTAELREAAADGSVSTDGAVLTSGTFDLEELDRGPSVAVSIELLPAGAPVPLDTEKTYALVLSVSKPSTGVVYLGVASHQGENPYAAGTAFGRNRVRADAGTSWAPRSFLENAGLDLSFVVSVEPRCSEATQVFAHTGALQEVSVPPGCTGAAVKLWGGAGGGRTGTFGAAAARGGAGGYSAGVLENLTRGEKLRIVVGGGGSGMVCTDCRGVTAPGGFGGGGDAGVQPVGGYLTHVGAGGGGGRSAVAVFRVDQWWEPLVAGGGGGAALHFTSSTHPSGGGVSGRPLSRYAVSDGCGTYSSGTGGTATSGGLIGANGSCSFTASPAATAGLAGQGGRGVGGTYVYNGNTYLGSGGGGGGGRFGGGGGGKFMPGGGGSGWASGSSAPNPPIVVTGGTTLVSSESVTSPPNASDPDRLAFQSAATDPRYQNIGVSGGFDTTSVAHAGGGHGLLIVTWRD